MFDVMQSEHFCNLHTAGCDLESDGEVLDTFGVELFLLPQVLRTLQFLQASRTFLNTDDSILLREEW